MRGRHGRRYRFEFLRHLRISSLIVADIDDGYFLTVFYFAFTEFMQKRTPLWIMLQVIGDTFGEKNVAGIAAIHHALGDIDAGAGDVRLFVQVSDVIDRSAVDSHSHA